MKTLAEMRAKLLAEREQVYDNSACAGLAEGQAIRHAVQLVGTFAATMAVTAGRHVKGIFVGVVTRTEAQPIRPPASDRVAKRAVRGTQRVPGDGSEAPDVVTR